MGYPEYNLPPTAIASSLGKVNVNSKPSDYKTEDLAAAILIDMTYHIAQIPYHLANSFGMKRIYFGGSYIHGHALTMDSISYGLNYWSKGEIEAVFLEHEAFLGVIGALLNYDKFNINKSVSVADLGRDSMHKSDNGEIGLSKEIDKLEAEIDNLQHEKAVLCDKLDDIESKYALAMTQLLKCQERSEDSRRKNE